MSLRLPQLRRAYVGLGANLGPARTNLAAAVAALAAHPAVQDLRASSLYRSTPVDAQGPDFLNAVVGFNTALQPLDLLDLLQQLEQSAGRQRPYPNAPRTLDLDLLLLGKLKRATPRLSLPHPRLQERLFVLAPLGELAPELCIPGAADPRSVGAQAAALAKDSNRLQQFVEKVAGPAQWLSL